MNLSVCMYVCMYVYMYVCVSVTLFLNPYILQLIYLCYYAMLDFESDIEHS